MMKGVMWISLLAMPKALLSPNWVGMSKSMSTSLCKEIAGVSAKFVFDNFVVMRSLSQQSGLNWHL